MNPPRTFRCLRDIIWGRGSLVHLETIGRKRVLIMTDAVMTRLGVTARAEEFLRRGVQKRRYSTAWNRSLR